MPRTSASLPALVVLFAAASCVPPVIEPHWPRDAGSRSAQHCSITGVCLDAGSCAANADCADGKICDPATSTCVPGSECGSTAVTASPVAPTLMIALDRSCSMTKRVGGRTKWEIAVDALDGLTTTFDSQMWFGLTLFPDAVGDACTQDRIPIPVGPMNEPAIGALLGAALDAGDPGYPDGPCVTNIDTGVQQAASDPGLREPTRRGFVLLLTDGKQAGCTAGGGNAGTAATVSELRDAGIDTFVIGFGGDVSVAQLNDFADRGGQPSGDPLHHFYLAEDQTSLEAALGAIGAKTLGCTYALATVPPDPSRLFVFFDGDHQVLRDPSHAGGWDYDAASNRVTFYGTACEDLEHDRVAKLDIVYGCPVPAIN